ncbi:RraA family protein [Microbacterium sp. NPDC057650]|uniref:RraA family protein n=1 Tax=unclassified Microbacterium TaxID=2609290 RepID=UPI00366AA690
MNPRTDAELFELMKSTLYTPVVGDILDALGHTHQFLPPQIQPMRPHMKIAGRAMPVVVSDVYGPQKKPFGHMTEALDQLEPGEVWVGSRIVQSVAMWGEMLTATSQGRGAVGAVVDGYHRDTPQILERDFPVFSWGGYAQDSSVRTAVRDFRVPVELGGVRIEPGDLVFGDMDGVLVIPRAVEDEVIEASLAKASTENLVATAIDQGMSATEAFARFGVL